MKNWIMLILSIVLVTSTAVASPKMVDRIAAVVNNGVILESEVKNAMHLMKVQASQSGQQLPDDNILRHQVIEHLVMDSIIFQIGKQMGIQISDQQLDQVIANIAMQNHMTLSQMRIRLAYDDVNYNTYREQIRKRILIDKVRTNEVRRRITILPHEVDIFAKMIAMQNTPDTELNINHILLPLPDNPTLQQLDIQEKLANTLINELDKGIDFTKLVFTHSVNSQELKGSNMGWRKIDDLPDLFAMALSTAKKGDLVGPIRSDIGFHILQINDLRSGKHNSSVTEAHVCHILLKPSLTLTDNQVRHKLMQIADDIKKREISFTEAAKRLSDDSESANQGGDLGWNPQEIYDPAFRYTLLRLKKGEMSQPVHSSFGWHLIKLLDKRKVDKTDAIRNEYAYRLLFNRKFTVTEQIWMQDQRASAYVKILDAYAQ